MKSRNSDGVNTTVVIDRILTLRDISPFILIIDSLEHSAASLCQYVRSTCKANIINISFACNEGIAAWDLSLHQVLGKVNGRRQETNVIMIDCLNCIDVSQLASYLSALIGENTSIVGVLHRDIPSKQDFGPNARDLLSSLATTVLTISNFSLELAKENARRRAEIWEEEQLEGVLARLESNHGPCVVSMDHRRKSGRSVFERFRFDGKAFTILSSLSPWKDTAVVETATAEVEALTTFNLGTTDAQREARENVVLPHFAAQSSEGSGRIWYQADREDDFDDEEPDEDLY